MKIKWSKGFTLIELMLVFAVAVVILIAIVASAIEGSKNREEAMAVVNHSQTASIKAHTAGHGYTDRAYYKEVIINVSDDYQPVCVHGIPGFIPRRGPEAGEFIQLNEQRGYSAGKRFWIACQDLGNELVKEHEED